MILIEHAILTTKKKQFFFKVCTVGKIKESGSGGSKKDAKREAAQKMIDKLKALGPNGSEQVCIIPDRSELLL